MTEVKPPYMPASGIKNTFSLEMPSKCSSKAIDGALTEGTWLLQLDDPRSLQLLRLHRELVETQREVHVASTILEILMAGR